MTSKKTLFGKIGNKPVNLYWLENKNGVKIQITNFGGIVTKLFVPDKNGNSEDIVLGYEHLQDYIDDPFYFGAIVGRCGNRISNANFYLDGKQYHLAKNQGKHHLHGGTSGFNKKIWKVEKANAVQIKLSYTSEHMEEGYPGTLKVKVKYILTEKNELKIKYHAVSDRKTICNLTHHSYFNFAGAGNGHVLDHEIFMNADRITEVVEDSIPTGKLLPVASTPFDFNQSKKIGKHIEAKNKQMEIGNGYDQNFVLNKKIGKMVLAASVFEPVSGRYMEVYTDQPGMQLYTSNYLHKKVIGKKGKIYDRRSAFCLETQHLPDTPNRPEFPSIILEAGEKYKTKTIHKFSVK